MNMKMSNEDFENLEQAINRVIARYTIEYLVETYESGNFPRADKVEDVQRRLCFDLFYAAHRDGYQLSPAAQNELNSDHLYTALKRLCPKVVRKF